MKLENKKIYFNKILYNKELKLKSYIDVNNIISFLDYLNTKKEILIYFKQLESIQEFDFNFEEYFLKFISRKPLKFQNYCCNRLRNSSPINNNYPVTTLYSDYTSDYKYDIKNLGNLDPDQQENFKKII